MDLVELQIFKAVAESGGITSAAARLHRVQSNVTTRIKQLERRLGASLFRREKRRLVLSSEGRLLLGYADRLLRLSSEAQAALRNGAPQGLLRIGSLESTAAARLPPLLARYHRTYPEVRLELVTGTTGALVTRVLQGEIEAAFVAEPFTSSGLATLHAFTEELVLISPRRFDIKSEPHAAVLAFATGCSYRRRLEAWLGEAKIAPERVLECGSYHAIVACVAAGAGVAVVPRSVLDSIKGALDIETKRLPRETAVAKTCLVWREGHRSSALDALQAMLTSSPPATRSRSVAASPASRNARRRPAAARR